MVRRHLERHRLHRSGWLRAAVLGANDGVISTAALVVGVAAAETDHRRVLIVGLAGLVAGALSMAAGEYVSVSSQADLEAADLARERHELHAEPEAEKAELAGIWRGRGLSPDLAARVAEELTAHDALAAHARDELGITEVLIARPIQAAVASALSFAAGAALPVIAAALSAPAQARWIVSGVTLVSLALLGAAGARMGDAPVLRAVVRVVLWGALAMGVSSALGALMGVAIG